MATLILKAEERFGLWSAMNDEMDKDWFANVCAMVINFNGSHPDKLQITINETDTLSSSLFSYTDGGFINHYPEHVDSLRIKYKDFDLEVSPELIKTYTQKFSYNSWMPLDYAEEHGYETYEKEFEKIQIELPDDEDLLKIIKTVFRFFELETCEVYKNNKRFNSEVIGAVSDSDLFFLDDMEQGLDKNTPHVLNGRIIEIDKQNGTFLLEVNPFYYCLKIHYRRDLLKPEAMQSLKTDSSVKVLVSQISGETYLLSVDREKSYY
jgi:hypothetical protein